MRTTHAWFGSILVFGCGLVAPHRAEAAQTSSDCAAVAHADPVLSTGARIVLGEAHGNDQGPRLLATLACLAARRGPVRVALEIPSEEQPRIDAFLAGSDTASDRRQLLAGPFWTRPYQDGRSSEAMAELLDALHRLRRSGADVKVVTFDASDPDRDRAMAQRLLQHIQVEPRAIFLVLCGNLHARRTPAQPTQIPMIQRLVEAGVALTTFNAHYGVGTTWACTSDQAQDCGPVVWGRGRGKAMALVLARPTDGSYDGYFETGIATFSPPAAVVVTDVQRERGRLALLRSRAVSDYQERKFTRCASRYIELAGQDPTQRQEDWYNAACCFALGKGQSRAFSALERALAEGLTDIASLEADSDLASLHGDPRWAPMLARARALHGGTTPAERAHP